MPYEVQAGLVDASGKLIWFWEDYRHFLRKAGVHPATIERPLNSQASKYQVMRALLLELDAAGGPGCQVQIQLVRSLVAMPLNPQSGIDPSEAKAAQARLQALADEHGLLPETAAAREKAHEHLAAKRRQHDAKQREAVLRGVLTAIICMVALEAGAGVAWAANGCHSEASSSVLSFLTSATNFAIGIAGAGSVLMFAVAGLHLIGFHPTANIGWEGKGGKGREPRCRQEGLQIGRQRVHWSCCSDGPGLLPVRDHQLHRRRDRPEHSRLSERRVARRRDGGAQPALNAWTLAFRGPLTGHDRTTRFRPFRVQTVRALAVRHTVRPPKSTRRLTSTRTLNDADAVKLTVMRAPCLRA
jgi:hypothetical protein